MVLNINELAENEKKAAKEAERKVRDPEHDKRYKDSGANEKKSKDGYVFSIAQMEELLLKTLNDIKKAIALELIDGVDNLAGAES